MVTIEEIIQKVKSYSPDIDEKKILAAYEFAKRAHSGQNRQSGELYISHPLETTNILTEFGAEETVLIASLLHDVPEDTTTSLHEIHRLFGSEVSFLVDGITKLSVVHYRHDMAQRQIASLRKMLLHSTKDIRIILIKLADRLHNMRTLHFVPIIEKRLRIARETLEIYVPIANLLGMAKIKDELEDLCFQVLYPDTFQWITNKVKEISPAKEEFIKITSDFLRKHFKKKNLHSEITTHFKSLYTIYQKVEEKKKDLKKLAIEDFITFILFAKNKDECYLLLGRLHQLFKPKPGQVKDYIALPKTNGYRSLHTTVIGINGLTTDFQIRTRRMQLVADYGIAADFLYEKNQNHQLKKQGWAERILDLQKETKDNQDFLENLRVDIFQDRIFNFTPKGELIDLPVGANCIDFAYAIHSEVGNKAVSAEIDGKEVPLTAILKGGQTVKIICDENQIGPKRAWLDGVKSNFARKKIREYFKTDSKENKIKLGKEILSKLSMRAGRNFNSFLVGFKSKKLFKKLKISNLEELFLKVGEDTLNPQIILAEIFCNKNYLQGDIIEKKTGQLFTIRLKIKSLDRVGILQEMLNKISSLGINIQKVISLTKNEENSLAETIIYIEVKDLFELQKIYQSLEEVSGIVEIKRLFSWKKIMFYITSFLCVIFWGIHPLLVSYSQKVNIASEVISALFTYFGLISILGVAYSLHLITYNTFPNWKEKRIYWIGAFLLIFMGISTIILEGFFFHLDYESTFILLFAFFIYVYLFIQYRRITKGKEKTASLK